MKTLKNKNIVRLLILISLIVVVGISFIVTTAVYKGTHIGSGSLVLDKGIYIDISDVSSGELSKNMEMPIQYYLDKVTSETNRVQFSVKPSSEAEYYIANPTITAQDSSQAFYLRLKLNAQYYVNGSSTPTTFSMSASEKNTLFQLFATDSNYSPVLFNDCFAADANGEYYYYVSGGYGVATKNNLAQVTSGMEISLFKGFLANGTTPVSVINFREFEKVPENVTNITLSLDIELAIEPNNWNLPDVTLLTENDVTVSLVDNEYEITKINTSATSYALPGYYQGNAITRIGTTSPSALDDDAITVWFANTMTHVGGYRGVSTLQKIYLGNNVSEICDSAFGYSGLTGNLVLPISIQKIGKESLGDLNTTGLFPYIPNCMSYGLGAFKNDAGFTGTLTIRGEIYEHAFKDMSGIDTLKISSGTTLLENDPHSDNFAGMSSLKKVFIDSSAVAGLASSGSGLLENENLTDVYIKSDLTIGAYFANHSNFVETESNVAGYRHFGRSYQLTFNGGNIDGTLDAKLWNYAGSAGYSSSNTGNNGKYSFSGKNATTRIGINGVNTFYLPMPIISGYTFDGWYTTADGVGGAKVATADGWIANVSGYTSENGSWIRASATTLYAHYTKKEYSISYDFAGGTKGTNAPSSYIFGNTTAISNPTRKGYLFTGWNVSVSLTGRSLATIDIYTGVQEYVASYPDAVYYELFYAHKDISYTAALSGGQIRWRGYTTAGAYSSSLSSSSNYISSTDAYVALWYHLGKEDNNTTYTYNYTGDNLSIDSLQVGNLTLTAKWTPITYTIQYNGNGNTSGSTANSSHTYDQAKALTANGFVKTGYTFEGWATSATGEVVYNNKQSVTNLSSTQGDTVNLYAKWTENRLIIKYHLNGGTDVANDNNFQSGDPCLTQKWPYTFTTEYGLTNYDNITRVYRTGYKANKYYNTKSDGTGYNLDHDALKTTIQIAEAAHVLADLENGNVEIDIYMIWTPITYTIKYDGNGNTSGSTANSLNTYDQAKDLTANGFVRTGYTFEGWATSATGEVVYNNKQSVINLSSTQGATITLYAKWKPITYTIKYDGNGNTGGSTANSSHTYDQAKALTANSFSKTGYTFAGWATSKTGAVVYTNKQSVTNLSSTQGDTITLYAKWTANTYAETFLNSYISIGTGAYNNGGTWTVSNGEYSFKTVSTTSNGGPYLTNLYSLMSNGEKYRIYFTAKATTAISLTASFEAGGSKAISLTTGYQEFFVDVTYNASSTYKALTFYSTGWTGQTLSIKDIKVAKIATFNSTYGTLPTPTRTGYTFNGWSKNFFNPTLTYGYTSTCTRNGEIFTFDTGSQNSSSLFFEIQAWNNTSNIQGIFSATSTGVHSFVFTKNSSITQLRFKYNGNKVDSCFYYDVSSLPDGSYVIQVNITTIQMNKIVVKDIMIEQNANNSKTAYVSSTNYVLASSTVNEPFNRTLFVSWTLNESYLLKDWTTALTNNNANFKQENIKTIQFVNTAPSGSGYTQVSVGATTSAGTTAFVSGTAGVSDVIAYVKANSSDSTKYDIIFYSPVTIYAPVDSSYLFSNKLYTSTLEYMLKNLTSISLENFNTSKVTNMSHMFFSCESLTSLNVSSFNTSNVTNMGSMFSGCSSLTSLNLSNFNTSNVTNMSYMFDECSKLTSLNLSNFNTSNVTNMQRMFFKCSKLASLNLSNFNTSNVTNMVAIFNNCQSLTSLDLSNFDTRNVTEMAQMFYHCSSLTSLNLSSFDMSKVTNTTIMLGDCSKLTEIKTPKAIGSKAVDLPAKNGYSWLDNANTNNAYTQITSACTNKTLVLRENNSYLRKDWATALKNNNANFKQENIKTIQFVKSIPSGSGYTQVSVGATTSAGTTAFVAGTAGVSDVIAYVKANSSDSTKYDVIFYSPVTIYAPIDSISLFYELTALSSITFDNFNTSKVTNMWRMFYYCSSLTSLNVSSFDTSKVIDMEGMFYYCRSLTSLNISNFNTSSVTNMSNMFRNCESLNQLSLSNFDTSNVTDMSYMFATCKALTYLDVSNFNTIKVTNMADMFFSCSSLTSLNVSNFNTNNVTNMSSMFCLCTSLLSISLDSFNTSKVTNMLMMFSDCESLTNLVISSFDMSKVTSSYSMFYDCPKLTIIQTPKTMGSTTVDLPGTSDSLHAWYKSTDSNRNTPCTTLSSSNTNSIITLRPIMRNVTITWGSDSNGNGDWAFNAQWNGSVQVSSSQGGTQSGTRTFRVEATNSIQCSFWIQSPAGLIWHKTGSVSISGTCTNSNFGSNTAPTAKREASRTANASNFKSDITISFYFSASK